jgi:ParB family chromosome partitioning protein
VKRVDEIRSIPISSIAVISSRVRNKRKFKELTKSVADLGLKRPITVSRRQANGAYELVCGEVRLKAYRALGRSEIPAVLIDADGPACLLMGLVENLARCRHGSVELLSEVERLAASGYSMDQVAAKLGFSPGYVRDVWYLLKHGEERLLVAVDKNAIPHTIAVEIAKAKSGGVQKALLETYVKGPLTSKQIAAIRNLVEQRLVNGKAIAPRKQGAKNNNVTSSALTRAYRREAERQKVVAQKAELTHTRLLIVVSALRSLLKERLFIRILREEGLNKMPLQLQRRLAAEV